MNILIAEDEEHSRAELRYLLQELAPNATIYEAENGQEALKMVGLQPIGVIFLDINMPGINGLAVASLLLQHAQPPLIIFATAYDQHAIRAFELQALDYILKPFHPARLAEAMARVQNALQKRDILAQKEMNLRNYLNGKIPARTLTKLWTERENEMSVLIDYQDILWLEANDKKVHVHTVAGEKLRVHLKMRELEFRLTPHNFARVQKGYIVNLDHMTEIQTWFSGSYIIHINDAAGSKIPLSRGYARQLKKRVGW